MWLQDYGIDVLAASLGGANKRLALRQVCNIRERLREHKVARKNLVLLLRSVVTAV